MAAAGVITLPHAGVHPAHLQKRQRRTLTCTAAAPSTPGKSFIDPVQTQVRAFAPATIANLGPGFDWLGCAVDVSPTHSTEHGRL